MGSNEPKDSCVRWESRGVEVLSDVANATNFGTKIAITGFVRTIATTQLVMEGGSSGRLTDCIYCRYVAPKGFWHGNHFLAFDGLKLRLCDS